MWGRITLQLLLSPRAMLQKCLETALSLGRHTKRITLPSFFQPCGSCDKPTFTNSESPSDLLQKHTSERIKLHCVSLSKRGGLLQAHGHYAIAVTNTLRFPSLLLRTKMSITWQVALVLSQAGWTSWVSGRQEEAELRVWGKQEWKASRSD